MRKKIFRTENILFILIVAFGAYLRFYKYAEFSLSNDELSALYRTQFSNINDLLAKGVKLDFHPAGIQIFLYYWVKVFGSSELSLRLPFVISGIVAVVFTYLISHRWFNKVTALFAALSVAFLQFPILYSQIARPYSTGLVFALITVYFWTLLIFDSQNRSRSGKVTIGLLYCLGTIASMYNHYFSFLFAVIVGFTGLFYLNPKTTIYYLAAGLLSVLFFLPHLNITLYHFSIGGLSEWLGKPDNDWFVNHIRYIFNESNILFMVFITIFLFTIIVNQKRFQFTKFHMLTIIWFLLPFFIAFFYSLYVNPVIQNSILIFSFPFLIVFLFSFFDGKLNFWKTILLIAFGVVGTHNTINVYDYYNKQHFGEFKDIAKTIHDWNSDLGKNNIKMAINANAPFYIHYYLNRYENRKIEFEQYENTGGEQLRDISNIVKNSNTEYFIYAWTKPAPSEIHEIIKTCYPFIADRKNYSGLSEVTIYSKKRVNPPLNEPEPVFSTSMSYEDIMITDSIFSDTNIVHSGKYSILIDSLTEFGPACRFPASSISENKLSQCKISLWAFVESYQTTQVVISINNKKDGHYYWASMQLCHQIEINEWGEVFFSPVLPELKSEGDQILIYVWNNEFKRVYVDDMKIDFYE